MNKQQTELFYAAAEVINDFDTYGEVIQTDNEGEYSPTTAIERLRVAIEAIRV